MDQQTWASVPWSIESHGSTAVFHKHEVPYTANANALQNMDIWIPVPSTTAQERPSPESMPETSGVWVIYVHGGAWRDPLVTSSSFSSTVSHLATSHPLTKIAGFASINYSLSPRTHNPKDPDYTDDPSRQAKHPDHITDVLTALAYLQAKAKFSDNYILLGHSCGATLALQVIMSRSEWNASSKVAKPIAVVGLNGLYDMPTLIREPGEKHAHLQGVYETFTRLAFGDDERVWEEISPISVGDWEGEWKGKLVVLVQSKEDSLVPYRQLVDMKDKLEKSRGKGLVVSEMEAGGDHNDLWKEGERLAEIVTEVVVKLGC
ncbi:alpha/beta-Hydrolase [Glarea lozoyensis ATCC 20868]|uniref:Kynurenine formamidase n=1 Tax=Glarea lozoyensis (strain ATCC 20868 / MF5171) TaxID=1116229 RepID=S3DDE8_GLAL2|nr:alpha/beta-Hydrolase [Glarea lozoyensis ATCC 20868]EPE35129.1 alpha/beta-Hydrolase [Glarea lozoyensis ATCC 20868]